MASKLFSFYLPPVLNEQLNAARSGVQVGIKQKTAWTQKIALAARNQNPERQSFKIAWVWAEYVVRTKAYDPDGLAATKKFIFDGFVAAGVFGKDNLTVLQSPSIEFFTVDSSLTKAEQFVNILLTDQPPELISFAQAVKALGGAKPLAEGVSCA